MLLDVRAACGQVGEVRICDAPGGQGAAVVAELASLSGPVAVVNADLPCVTPDEVRVLLAAAPALVAARDGTTNALALLDPGEFKPLYGEGSAARFGLRQLDLPGLREDVDTWDDLRRLAADVGPNTRGLLHVHA